MSHLNIICDAYDKCGVHYALVETQHYICLVLVADENEKKHYEQLPYAEALNQARSFMEFEKPDCSIASY